MRPAYGKQGREVNSWAEWKLLGIKTDPQQRSQEGSTVAWGIQVFPLGVPVTHHWGSLGKQVTLRPPPPSLGYLPSLLRFSALVTRLL